MLIGAFIAPHIIFNSSKCEVLSAQKRMDKSHGQAIFECIQT